ncbi:MAG: MATE family efflux transporter [Bacteroidaceae bacterium]|nr:MATE family efflux transporter [Bacteroidaceae bacterium]
MSDKRIMKNTIILYLRMIFQMAVYLYTTRLVIKALEEDYGIYDVVGSVVLAMMFLNNSMLNCTQRFITYALAEGDKDKLNAVFSHSLIIHIAFGLVIVLVGGLLGTWYIHEFMNVPQDKLYDALFVFYVSLASGFVTMVSVPYNALIIAKEHMGAFAAITIVDVLLKLLVALSLFYFNDDRLRMYALLLFTASLVVRVIYGVYCRIAYKEVRFVMKLDRKVLKSMLGFLGWNTIGNTAVMCNTQGLNLLLNMVGGTLLNAARGVAFQVQTATVSFINSFQTAINPQITKNYATGNLEKMNSLVLTSSRVSFLLMLFLIVPLLLLTDNILALWLTEHYPYTVDFVRLLIVVSIVDAISNPLMVGASATGKIKKYQLLVGGCMLCTIPIAYVVLEMGASPTSVFWSLLATTIIAQIVRMWLCRNLFNFSIPDFCSKVLLPILKVAVACFVPLLLLRPYYADCSGLNVIFVSIVLDIWVAACVFVLGLNRNERDFLLRKIKLK